MDTKQGIAFAAMMVFVVGGYLVVGRFIKNAPGPSAVQRQEMFVRDVLAADPAEILAASRRLLDGRAGATGPMDPGATVVPETLRPLHPTGIHRTPTSVTLSLGDAGAGLSIVAFAPGLAGSGDRKWIDGLWFLDPRKVLRDAGPSRGDESKPRPRSDIGGGTGRA